MSNAYEMPSTITPPWTRIAGSKPKAFVSGPHLMKEEGQIVLRYAMRDESGSWVSIHATEERAREARDEYNAENC